MATLLLFLGRKMNYYSLENYITTKSVYDSYVWFTINCKCVLKVSFIQSVLNCGEVGVVIPYIYFTLSVTKTTLQLNILQPFQINVFL